MNGHNNQHLQQLAKLFVLHEYIKIWKLLNIFYSSCDKEYGSA